MGDITQEHLVRTFTKEELFDLLDDDSQIVETGKWRHGHVSVYVFKYEGCHYRIRVHVHSDEGWQICDEETCERVKPVQRTVTDWVPWGSP